MGSLHQHYITGVYLELVVGLDLFSGARSHLVGWVSQSGSQASIAVSLVLNRSSQLRDQRDLLEGWVPVKQRPFISTFDPEVLISTLLKFNPECCTF